MSCRRCASSPGPTPFSTASGSSPPATPTSSATGGSSPGSDSPPRAMKRVASALETELARLAQLELRRSRTTVEAFPAAGAPMLLDHLNHAPLTNGSRPSAAELSRYPRADAGAAARLLARDPGRTALLGTDGVFSMDGDLAPLPELSRAARDAGAWLVVDDAHGLGVVGASGRGALEHFGLDAEEVPVLIGTLGKAFGSFGAFVAGGADLIELLIQKARPYIYTTALPQPVAAATRCALELIQTESWRRERLLCLTARFRRQAREAGVPLADSPTPIQPVLFGSAAAALAAQRELEEAGFWVVAIRPPTVPPGTSRLRVTLSATHTEAEVDELVGRLARCCSALARSALA